MDISTLKKEANELWRSAREQGLTLNTYGQCLDLVARLHGFADWNTIKAKIRGQYFFFRHLPYFGCEPRLTRALSLHQAIRVDLGRMNGGEDAPFIELSSALARCAWQIEQARSGALRVEPELITALKEGSMLRASALHEREELAAREFATVSAEIACTYHGEEHAGGFARPYQESYLKWRLATLARAFNVLLSADPEFHFTSLARAGVDMYGLTRYVMAGLKPRGSIEAIKEHAASWRRTNGGSARAQAKTLLLGWLGGYHYAPSRGGVAALFENASYGAVAAGVSSIASLEETFPEILVWQIWAELKPLLAPFADDFHRERKLS